MSDNVFLPGPEKKTVRKASGEVIPVPQGWAFFPPGDAALTRRVKAAGEFWLLQEKKGRRMFSRGIWAPAETIERIRQALEAERSTDAYAKKQAAAAKRREANQAEYVEDFTGAVRTFLAFHASHDELANQLAEVVTKHATPVGSGTVARTKRIPIEKRAEAAVIAWMRHQTTAYDSMKIARIKGERREVRRRLARRSKELLAKYRSGQVSGSTDAAECPLAKALRQ